MWLEAAETRSSRTVCTVAGMDVEVGACRGHTRTHTLSCAVDADSCEDGGVFPRLRRARHLIDDVPPVQHAVDPYSLGGNLGGRADGARTTPGGDGGGGEGSWRRALRSSTNTATCAAGTPEPRLRPERGRAEGDAGGAHRARARRVLAATSHGRGGACYDNPRIQAIAQHMPPSTKGVPRQPLLDRRRVSSTRTARSARAPTTATMARRSSARATTRRATATTCSVDEND